MILIALLLAAQQPVPAPTAAAEDEIVVLARRLARVRWSYDTQDGVLRRCTIKRSGGALADTLVCDATRQCAAENPRTGDRHLAPCIKARVQSLFAERRAAIAGSAARP